MKQPTLQEQYNLLSEGRGNKNAFMKSALRQFPNLFNNFTNYDTAVTVLKQKQIISEAVGGVATGNANPFMNWEKFLAEEAKAEEKKPTKEVTDMETAGFDYKDEKNIDNLYGEAFLQGFYTEMEDPKNEDKSVDELKEIVAKNLAKDRTYYATEAQFGIKGIGYTDDAPGLAVSDKEIKGKYASSGMEEVKLKEDMIKLTDLINEAIGGYVDLRPAGMTTENARTDAGKVTTLEAQIEALDEAIETKNQRISMVSEDENLSELVDKVKMKEMQREVKDLERRKAKMEKLYEKMCGKAYSKPEMVDEVDEMEY